MSAGLGHPLLETAYAKINLALHVRRRREDGYHELETLFAFAADGDELAAEAADALSLNVTGPFADALPSEGDNLVLRAARALRDRTGVAGGARLTLNKRLPVASGIGGGSADAAATLRLLSRLWELGDVEPLLIEIAGELGSDVPACVRSEAVRGSGRGERLGPIGTNLAGTPLLLVNPRVPLATGPVFRGWDGVDRGPLGKGEPVAAALAGRNDLELPARALVPQIGELLASLAAQPGVRLARMSGSGATCFALFGGIAARDTAAARIAEAQPGWWLMATEIR